MPCLDEAENVEKALSYLCDVLDGVDYEVIVIDDQSVDDTIGRAERWIENSAYRDRYVVLKKDLNRRGYGAVIKYGLAYASGDYVIFYSADMVDPIHLIHDMLELSKDHHIVQVSRYMNRGDASTIPFKYKFYQFFFRYFVWVCLGEKIEDSTYAFKLMDRKRIQALGITSNRFNISPEIFFKCYLAGYKIATIEGAQGTRESGESKFIFMKEGPGFIGCLIRAFLHRKNLIYWF